MFSYTHYLTMPLIALVAVAIDWWLGEPRRYHPLVGFGWLAQQIEAKLNPSQQHHKSSQRWAGVLALIVLIAPLVGLALLLCEQTYLGFVFHTYFLYFAIGHKSLHQHAWAVSDALNRQDNEAAKLAASYMVSRDSAAIDAVPATVESVLENGNDGVFGALFWFFIAGGAGALAFRLVNTMDAMWGYKTPRYFYFGWAAARLDDVLDYVPARLTALTYALLGKTKLALHCWKNQAPLWDSPNAGPVMSAGAGALGVKLGGAARYQGEWHNRPTLGAGSAPVAQDIGRALKLVNHGVWVWLLLFLIASGMQYA